MTECDELRLDTRTLEKLAFRSPLLWTKASFETGVVSAIQNTFKTECDESRLTPERWNLF
jgi:hypothetical protein